MVESRPKYVGDYQYGMKCILPKCIRWLTIHYMNFVGVLKVWLKKKKISRKGTFQNIYCIFN